MLADGDLVSKTNCIRQPFASADVGLNKAVVLINRVNLFWGLRWQAHPEHFHKDSLRSNSAGPHLIIGCVDTRAARQAILSAVTRANDSTAYWLDLGNNASSGQYVLGQPLNAANRRAAARLRNRCGTLSRNCGYGSRRGPAAQLQRGRGARAAGAIHQSGVGDKRPRYACEALSLRHAHPSRSLLQRFNRSDECIGSRSRSLEKDTEAHSQNFIGRTQEPEIMPRIQVDHEEIFRRPGAGSRSQDDRCAGIPKWPHRGSACGKTCPTCSADSGYSHISDEEMKGIMKAAVNTVYSLLWKKENDSEAFAKSPCSGSEIHPALGRPRTITIQSTVSFSQRGESMFKELGPLLRQRTVVMILTRLEDETIRVNVIPRKLNESEKRCAHHSP